MDGGGEAAAIYWSGVSFFIGQKIAWKNFEFLGDPGFSSKVPPA